MCHGCVAGAALLDLELLSSSKPFKYIDVLRGADDAFSRHVIAGSPPERSFRCSRAAFLLVMQIQVHHLQSAELHLEHVHAALILLGSYLASVSAANKGCAFAVTIMATADARVHLHTGRGQRPRQDQHRQAVQREEAAQAAKAALSSASIAAIPSSLHTSQPQRKERQRAGPAKGEWMEDESEDEQALSQEIPAHLTERLRGRECWHQRAA